jgi:hypothetical protein
MKKNLLFIAVAGLVICAAFAAGFRMGDAQRGLKVLPSSGAAAILPWLSGPGPATAHAAAATCSTTIETAKEYCMSDCPKYLNYTAEQIQACKIGCVAFLGYIGSCRGKIVN